MASELDLLRLAESAARRADAYLRTVTRPADPASWTVKGRNDFVTGVDRTAERLIVAALLAGEPGSSIVGEELTPEVVTRGLVWIVDPLDGTTNFLHGYPQYAVSIAAAVDGQLAAGVVLHVGTDELFRAARGQGAWLGEKRLRVSGITEPMHALVGTGFPFRDLSRLDEYLAQFGRVVRQVSAIRRAGAASLDLAAVAAGRFEAFWEQRLAPWDIAAGTLLVREAGGRVTNFQGSDLGIEHAEVLAGNPAMHEWMLRTLETPK